MEKKPYVKASEKKSLVNHFLGDPEDLGRNLAPLIHLKVTAGNAPDPGSRVQHCLAWKTCKICRMPSTT